MMTPDRASNSLRALVIDDNRDAAEMLARLLVEVGWHAQSAYDGRTAILLAAQLKPHVILLDIMMPKMDGFEVRAALADIPGLERTRYIAVTASKEPAVWNHLDEAGFDSALVKPVALDSLVKVFFNLGVTVNLDASPANGAGPG